MIDLSAKLAAATYTLSEGIKAGASQAKATAVKAAEKMNDPSAWGPFKDAIETSGTAASIISVADGFLIFSAGIASANPLLVIGGVAAGVAGIEGQRLVNTTRYRRQNKIDEKLEIVSAITQGMAQGDTLLVHTDEQNSAQVTGKPREFLETIGKDSFIILRSDKEAAEAVRNAAILAA